MSLLRVLRCFFKIYLHGDWDTCFQGGYSGVLVGTSNTTHVGSHHSRMLLENYERRPQQHHTSEFKAGPGVTDTGDFPGRSHESMITCGRKTKKIKTRRHCVMWKVRLT